MRTFPSRMRDAEYVRLLLLKTQVSPHGWLLQPPVPGPKKLPLIVLALEVIENDPETVVPEDCSHRAKNAALSANVPGYVPAALPESLTDT